jgi:hypothetical protein
MKKSSLNPTKSKEQLSLNVVAAGPSPADLARIGERLLNASILQKALKRAKYRLLHVRVLEEEPDEKPARPVFSSRFRATILDYTNNRVLHVDGDLSRPQKLAVTELGYNPLPTHEEFEAAVEILRRRKTFGEVLVDPKSLVYPAMPPLIPNELPDGRSERIISVGVASRRGNLHEIVGVNLSREEIVRFDRHAPPTALADSSMCGVPAADQSTTQNAAGQVWVTVKQGNTTLWKFLVVRPAASSGTNGSGVELRYVDYRGKRVLYRAHVPILNVKYDGNACGPYRDWQNEEGMIQANGTDVAPGFRLCSSPAKTILDTGSDTGNFLGTAIYIDGLEVVLVNEMQAGWYRYVSMWRLHVNGTIKPRFGFSAVTSSCVCNVHHHHCYWRLDFDIRTAGNNRVREFNDPRLVGSSNWHDKAFEIRRPRDPSRKRKWRVENVSTGEGYEIIPGASDGLAAQSPDAPFGKGDLWFLRYRSTEIDDGAVAIGPPYEAGMDSWVNGESLNGEDVVVWYGAHFTHDVQHEKPGHFGHIVGPDLKPVNW